MKENFDDILRRKWEEQHFPVDESHRADMIELLNGRKRRRVFPIWWAGGLGVLAIAAGLLLLTRDTTEQVNVQSSHQDAHITNTTLGNQLPSDADQGNVKSNSSIGTDMSAGESNQSTAPITPTTETATSANSSAIPSPSTAPVKMKTPASSSAKMKQSSASQKQGASQQATPANTQGQSTISPAMTYRVDEEAVHAFSLPSEVVTVSVVDEDPIEQLTSSSTTTTTARNSSATSGLATLGISPIDYDNNKLLDQIQPATSFRKSLYLFGEAGAGMILPSKPEFTSGWKLRAGAGLGFRLSPRIQLSWAGGYLMQQGGFDFQRTSTVNQPGFGTRSSFNSLTPDRLHFVYTRVGAQYRMGRHLLGMHAGMQWLYGAQGTISIVTQDQFAPGDSETTEYTWVKTDGLRKIHWTGDVSYGYQITPRLAAMAGTDVYFSSFTVADEALELEGYYWSGAYASLHPFITLNYLIYGSR